ncbi:MAG: hypothetical protein RLP09_30635 [Sandaracinaceae bacterium]
MSSPRAALEIEQLGPMLERLATFGGVSIASGTAPWLELVGVAVEADGEWVARTSWLEPALPARDADQLLQRTVIRDPLYRLHLDAVLGSVLTSIADGKRWARLEELLAGRAAPFAPRFVALLEWLSRRQNCRASELGNDAWKALVAADHREAFAAWDRVVWGTAETTSLFTVLVDLYLPCLDQPVFVADSRPVLAKLVHAARSDEGVLCAAADGTELDQLIAEGTPARWRATTGDTIVASLVLPCVASAADLLSTPSTEAERLPVAVRRSSSTAHEPGLAMSLWALDAGHDVACVGARQQQWPEDADPSIPEGRQLPARPDLLALAKRRADSPEADAALQSLAAHPVHGLLLQVFLLEALDRELGAETLVLAPPTVGDVQDLEANTQVLYRPPQQRGESLREMRTVGNLDEALDRIALAVGLRRALAPYRVGIWSFLLSLFRDAKLVTAQYDRWALAAHCLDRLHGGGMMAGVIRKGKDLRDLMHLALQALWEEAATQDVGMVAHG